MLPRSKQDTQALVRAQERADSGTSIKESPTDGNCKHVMKGVERGRKSCPCVEWVRLGSEVLKDGHA